MVDKAVLLDAQLTLLDPLPKPVNVYLDVMRDGMAGR
jgi:hypothetical protein